MFRIMGDEIRQGRFYRFPERMDCLIRYVMYTYLAILFCSSNPDNKSISRQIYITPSTQMVTDDDHHASNCSFETLGKSQGHPDVLLILNDISDSRGSGIGKNGGVGFYANSIGTAEA